MKFVAKLKHFWRPRYIGGTGPEKMDNPLLLRWVLFQCPWFGIMVHKLLRSDHDRALHDHPWDFVSLILAGGYEEEYWNPTTERHFKMTNRPGSILVRPATWRHRVIIPAGRPAWTLIVKSGRKRRWGFWVPKAGDFFWCWWRKYHLTEGFCGDEVINFGGED